MARIVLFGPGPRFKGGISNYNTSLARALAAQPGTEVHIVSWTEQYPSIIPRDFIDRASRQDVLAGTNIQVHYLTNYNNPLSWAHTVRYILGLAPDRVVMQWAIALQGLPMGWMARRLHGRVPELIFDLHLVQQKEASSIDRWLTRYGLGVADTYIVHAQKTADELAALFPTLALAHSHDGRRAKAPARTILRLYHPVYDLFQPDPHFDIAVEKAKLGLQQHVLLFFGFIRKYKGLHHVIPAFARLAAQRPDVSLLIVGESFWRTVDDTKWTVKLKRALFGLAKKLVLRGSDDEQDYNPLALIAEHGLQERVVVVNRFVPNEEVHRFFQVADYILCYYLTATPSGVESLAYNFSLPVLATRVGHFPETVRDGYNGYLAQANDIADMAAVMQKALAQPIDRKNVTETAAHLSWQRYAQVLLGTAA